MIYLLNSPLRYVDGDIGIVYMNEVAIRLYEAFTTQGKVDFDWSRIVGLKINTNIHTPCCVVIIN